MAVDIALAKRPGGPFDPAWFIGGDLDDRLNAHAAIATALALDDDTALAFIIWQTWRQINDETVEGGSAGAVGRVRLGDLTIDAGVDASSAGRLLADREAEAHAAYLILRYPYAGVVPLGVSR